MTKTVTFANFKGGVGKTTASVMFSYLLQKMGKKVLLVDFDPQYNATEIIFNTFDIDKKVKVSLFEAITEQNLSKGIMKVTPTLDILPSELDLVGFPMHLYSLTSNKEKRFFFLNFLLDEIKSAYDYVIIDVPPTISDFTNNAIVASDYTLLIMQTHQQSFGAAVKFIDYLRDLQVYNRKIDLIGVIPYLMHKRGKVDNEVIVDAKKIFKDTLFEKCILRRERVKLFGKNGIKEDDMHDLEVLSMYQEVVEEFLERVEG